MKIKEIISFLDSKDFSYDVLNNNDIDYDWFCDIHSLENNKISWIKKISNYSLENDSIDKYVLFVTDAKPTFEVPNNYSFIVCGQPKVVFFEIIKHFFYKEKKNEISPNSIIKTSTIGENVSIGHYCFIDENVKIGNNVVIKNNVSIECPTSIGDNCIIGSGVVIGSSGFGYYDYDDCHKKVPDFGGVIIGKEVEIGSNTCIDRGTLGNTIIKDGTKIDNLCHIAHNAIIDENCIIIAGSVICGSTHLEKNVYVAPGSLVMNQIVVGENSFLGIGSIVLKSVEKNKVLSVLPARVIGNRFDE